MYCVLPPDLVRPDATEVRALGSGESLLGPAVGVAVGVEKRELLGDAEPGPLLP